MKTLGRLQNLPEDMTILRTYWSQASKLSLQVMKIMGLGLGMSDPEHIANSHNYDRGKNESAIRVNFYPKTAGKGRYVMLLFL